MIEFNAKVERAGEGDSWMILKTPKHASEAWDRKAASP